MKKWLLRILTLLAMLSSPAAFAQEDEDDDGSVFVEPNQSSIDSLLSLM